MAVRIIGGQFRGRKLEVPTALGLRPTPDRVRETLFNWLQANIFGARCLDLFSGSGALSLEALSRGAGYVVAIEKDPKICQVLKARVPKWQLKDDYKIVKADAFHWLAQFQEQPFDCVFVDPPFQMQCLDQVISLIRQQKVLIEGGLVYLERPHEQVLPLGLAAWKEQKAGALVYGLYKLADTPSIMQSQTKTSEF